MSPLSCPPTLPLNHEAGLGGVSVELGRGGEERDGHAVSPPLPVCSGLGENHKGVGAVCRLQYKHNYQHSVITGPELRGSNYEGIFIIIAGTLE